MRRLFGSNGIRGVAGVDLPIEMVQDLGRALGTTLPEGSDVCVANDARQSAEAFRAAFASGLTSTGVNAVLAGRMPTPALAGLTLLGGYRAGVMITASHNPPEYNGVKFHRADGMGFGVEEQRRVEEAFAGGRFRTGHGTVRQRHDALEAYRAFIVNKASSLRRSNLRVLVDSANGAMAGFATSVFRECGIEAIPVNDSPKAVPDRDAEPKPSTLVDTICLTRELGADLAVCFDGDADRVVFCDRHGFLGFNEMIGFVARERVKDSPAKRVATTVETGRLVDLAVADVGGLVLRGMVGDISVAHLTRDEGCCIGVEQVGHYINPSIGYYPDTLYTALFLMSRISSPDDIREFYAGIPRLWYEKAGFRCPNAKLAAVGDFVAAHAGRFGADHVNLLDGVRLEFPDAWMLIRASGTQPLVRVIVEADSEARLSALLQQGEALVAEALE